MKSNSRAYVPHALRATSCDSTQNTHKRTQSSEAAISTTSTSATEAQASKKKTTQPRLVDVRPRYLEPRKLHGQLNGTAARGPVRSATSSSIPSSSKTKGARHLSSSDSSRHSSPVMRKGNAAANKASLKSAHISMDSLASPSKRAGRSGGAARGKSSDNERFSDVGADSLAESMRSSIATTHKTISQESLKSMSKFSRSNPLMGNKSTSQLSTVSSHNKSSSNSNNNGKLNNSKAKLLGSKATRHLAQQHFSAGSSPSSVATSKSATSRLSSVSSNQSSRELYKRSISVPGQPSGIGTQAQRYSFLSAKSREILAKRAEKNKQQQQQQQQQQEQSGDEVELRVPLRSASTTNTIAALAANRSSLPTNIPMRRPNTLQLKKTSSFNSHRNSGPKAITNGAQQRGKSAVGKQRADNNTTTTTEATKTTEPAEDTRSELVDMMESKLQRSSTFCKESSAIDIHQLQIIE